MCLKNEILKDIMLLLYKICTHVNNATTLRISDAIWHDINNVKLYVDKILTYPDTIINRSNVSMINISNVYFAINDYASN